MESSKRFERLELFERLEPLAGTPLSAELIRSVLPGALSIGESLRILFAKSLDRGC